MNHPIGPYGMKLCNGCQHPEWPALLKNGVCPTCAALVRDNGSTRGAPVEARCDPKVMEAALRVLVLTPVTRWLLKVIDPQALRQAEAAINDPVGIAAAVADMEGSTGSADPRVKILFGARALLASLLPTFDRGSKSCGGCQRVHFSNWTEGQMALEVEAIMRKLDKKAERLTRQAAGLDTGNEEAD